MSTVIIRSPRPNHNRITVMSQTVDDHGNPVGEPVAVAVLDDGEEATLHFGKNDVLTVHELPRNVEGPSIPVIGGSIMEPLPSDGSAG